ncbi:MAG: hypothetical protein DRR19_17665 [Candidatus Parabeggiatoa sp. nov. 1]|nr:MAG: hypothetical protein DRR19_17665 [Gammaproteobacteria bacterium]
MNTVSLKKLWGLSKKCTHGTHNSIRSPNFSLDVRSPNAAKVDNIAPTFAAILVWQAQVKTALKPANKRVVMYPSTKECAP